MADLDHQNRSPGIKERSPKIRKLHHNNAANITQQFLLLRVEKLSENAIFPSRASPFSAGYNLSRSGLAWKHSIDVGAGVIDADYRGEVGVILFNHLDVDFAVKVGDRIAQLIIEKIMTLMFWKSRSWILLPERSVFSGPPLSRCSRPC
ncbi:hypothetical protein Nepgr_024713 [Nepenthes gracilis]|uniref:Deoxyuridine 5'-triphosphate nucleotidohydrolase n=1 Tax=Nepenthes gracilis TaxID=150966 RepID=A0AAD3T4N4_NEPGR|nr:hypothetical protein Nepgr_024713 [Nepenthes gracilis]